MATVITIEQVKEWLKLQTELKSVKKREADLRKVICAAMLQGQIGTVHMLIGNINLTAASSIKYTADNEAAQAIWAELSPEEQMALRFKAEINKALYEALPAGCPLSHVVTAKPTAPTLKAEEVEI